MSNSRRFSDLSVIEEITDKDYFVGTRDNGDDTFTDYLYSMQAVLNFVGSTGGGGSNPGNLVFNNSAGNLIFSNSGNNLTYSS